MILKSSPDVFDISVTMEPTEPLVCDTENLTFTCTSTSPTADLRIKRNNIDAPESEITRINDTTILYTMTNISTESFNDNINCIDNITGDWAPSLLRVSSKYYFFHSFCWDKMFKAKHETVVVYCFCFLCLSFTLHYFFSFITQQCRL